MLRRTSALARAPMIVLAITSAIALRAGAAPPDQAAAAAPPLASSPAPASSLPALVPLPAQPDDVAWPARDWPAGAAAAAGADAPRLARALQAAFAEPDPARPVRTRAVLVVHRGRLVVERYGDGVSRDTRLLGWSMTKSVLAAVVGLLAGDGRLDLAAPASVPAWRGPDDPRGAITLDQLLRASSGLAWNETYEAGPLRSSVIAMLYRGGRRDMASFAAGVPLAHPPDSVWSYSSGTSLVISGIVRRAIGGDAGAVLRFARERLFAPIGAESFVLERDASGTWVASSYSWATARDWARFGLLHLRDGVWEGRRILPAGWVDRVRTPTPTSARGEYGAHWWLNAGPRAGGALPIPAAPRDLFYASGHDGQAVALVPSRDLVVVRLGLTPADGRHDVDAAIAELIACFPELRP